MHKVTSIFWSAAAAAFLVVVSGCGGDDSGGGAGGGGQAAPRAAFHLNFVSAGASCPVASHTASFGDVGASEKGSLIADGVDGASVECKVTGTDAFEVTAKATSTQDGVGISLSIPSISASASDTAPAPGSVSMSSPNTAGEVAQSPTTAPCTFRFTPGTGEGVDEGKIWVAFDCADLKLDMGSCQLAESYAIFENCDI